MHIPNFQIDQNFHLCCVQLKDKVKKRQLNWFKANSLKQVQQPHFYNIKGCFSHFIVKSQDKTDG